MRGEKYLRKRVFAIKQQHTHVGFNRNIFHYDFPGNFQELASIGAREKETDIWRINYTDEKLLEILRKSDYCYIMRPDNILKNNTAVFLPIRTALEKISSSC